MKKYKVEYYYMSEDSKGNEVEEPLGVNTLFDHGKVNLTALAFRVASFKQQKANRLKFFRVG